MKCEHKDCKKNAEYHYCEGKQASDISTDITMSNRSLCALHISQLLDSGEVVSCFNCGGYHAGDSIKKLNDWIELVPHKKIQESLRINYATTLGLKRYCIHCFKGIVESFTQNREFRDEFPIEKCQLGCGRGDSWEYVLRTNTFAKNAHNFVVMGKGLNARRVCEICTKKVSPCTCCGRVVVKKDSFDKYGCRFCTNVNMHTVESYNFVPLYYPKFVTKNDPANAPTFGMEFEFYVGDRDRNLISGLLHTAIPPDSRFMCKHDGSVDPGFEVVTMPMTRSFLSEGGEALLYKIFQVMRDLVPDISNLVDSHPNCGLHVHLGRECLTPLQIYKMASFSYANVINLCKIGRREPNQYCKTDVLRSISDQVIRKGGKDERYRIVNLTNDNTIEFRFFKGTTNIHEVLTAIEFVDSLRLWCAKASMKDKSWSKYFEFISERYSKFQNLLTHISKIGVKEFKDQKEKAPSKSRPAENMQELVENLRINPNVWLNEVPQAGVNVWAIERLQGIQPRQPQPQLAPEGQQRLVREQIEVGREFANRWIVQEYHDELVVEEEDEF